MKIKFGEVVKKLREKNGITQEKLAIALGVTPQAVSRWELGGGYPDFELVPQIAVVLQTTPDKLFCMDIDEQKKKEYIDNLTVRVVSLDYKDVIAEYRIAHEMYPEDMLLTFLLARYITESLINHLENYSEAEVDRLFSEAEILFLRVMERSSDDVYKNAAKIYLIQRLYCKFDREKAVALAKKEDNPFYVMPLLTPEERIYYSKQQMPSMLARLISFCMAAKNPEINYEKMDLTYISVEELEARVKVFDSVYNYLGTEFCRKESDYFYRNIFKQLYIKYEDDDKSLAALGRYVELSKNISGEYEEFGQSASSLMELCGIFTPCSNMESSRKDILEKLGDGFTYGNILSAIITLGNDDLKKKSEHFKDNKRFQQLLSELDSININIDGIITK